MLESYATTLRRGLLGSFVEKSFEMEKERMDKDRRGERKGEKNSSGEHAREKNQ